MERGGEGVMCCILSVTSDNECMCFLPLSLLGWLETDFCARYLPTLCFSMSVSTDVFSGIVVMQTTCSGYVTPPCAPPPTPTPTPISSFQPGGCPCVCHERVSPGSDPQHGRRA